MTHSGRSKTLVALAAVACGFGALSASTAMASDHFEAPETQWNIAADLTDIYMFPGEQAGMTAMVVCFAGLSADSLPNNTAATYDENVLYTLHIDNDASDDNHVASTKIHWRFGQNSKGEWGVKIENVPGTTEAIVGAVDSTLTAGNAKVWTGNADDPFFFDAAGYLLTLGSGDLMMTKDRDFLAGSNVTAMVIEVPTADLQSGDKPLQIWSTTGIRD